LDHNECPINVHHYIIIITIICVIFIACLSSLSSKSQRPSYFLSKFIENIYLQAITYLYAKANPLYGYNLRSIEVENHSTARIIERKYLTAKAQILKSVDKTHYSIRVTNKPQRVKIVFTVRRPFKKWYRFLFFHSLQINMTLIFQFFTGCF